MLCDPATPKGKSATLKWEQLGAGPDHCARAAVLPLAVWHPRILPSISKSPSQRNASYFAPGGGN